MFQVEKQESSWQYGRDLRVFLVGSIDDIKYEPLGGGLVRKSGEFRPQTNHLRPFSIRPNLEEIIGEDVVVPLF